jgi:aromatic ring-opening dioxygenase catalytic subunit (LigB family)
MYAMDAVHTFPAQAELAEKLIEQLIERDFDIGSAARVDDPKTLGFGHAYGFVAERIFRGREVPIVPVMLNTYFPPNAPTPRRCYNLGMAIKESLEAIPMDLRVAVVGSGGLSHFIVEEEFDRQILKALETHDEDVLRSLPVNALKSGSSEIRCWITAGGAFRGLKHQWSEYIPARRTPAGTGIGLGFATWY